MNHKQASINACAGGFCKARVLFLAAVVLVVLLPAAVTVSAANRMLMVSPVRAIFTDRERYVSVNVSNPTQETIHYQISLVTLEKMKNGQMREVGTDSADNKMVKDMIRYSPRRSTIAPGSRQVVKLMVRKPADLKSGEYITHLKITPMSGEQGVRHSTGGGDASFARVDILVAVSIPVIIQHAVDVDVSPVSFRVAGGGDFADVKLARRGDASGFGNVRLMYIPSGRSDPLREIGHLQGVALYKPDATRTVRVPLGNVSAKELQKGTVRVEFQPDSSAGSMKRIKNGKKTFADFPL